MRVLGGLGLLLLSVVVAGSAGAADPPAYTPVGTLAEPAVSVALGPDGNVWHTSRAGGGRVGFTTPGGATTEYPGGPSAELGAITAGPDGALWFVQGKRTLGRITTAGHLTVTRDLQVEPRFLTTGRDGNLWFTAHDTRSGQPHDAVARLTPSGALTIINGVFGSEPQDITAGPDGALWATETGARRIARITTSGAVTEFPVPGEPLAISAGPDGALWFTEKNDRVARMTTAGTVKEYPAGHSPDDIAVGPDGALYYTLDHAVGRVTTAGAVTGVAVGDAEPAALAGAADGVYFADAKHRALGRIDVASSPLAGNSATPTPTLAPTAGGGSGSAGGPPPGSGPAAAPERAKSVVATVRSGTVRVKPPGRWFLTLGPDAASVPVGSVFDTRHGTVRVESQTARGDQAALFHGGLFAVRQRADGRTGIFLRGRLDCASSSALASTARKRRKRRRVWGKDSGGRYSTHGRDSVTTVRGTEWMVADTCRGTLTRVRSGAVVVRDKRTGKRHVLRAGQRHFTRHRRP